MGESPARHLNNFDLLRLLAAAQVVYLHFLVHLGVRADVVAPLTFVINFFPGVPIFFVISGFLVSKSWERSTGLAQYARNRFLRIYPALWIAFLLSVALLLLAGAITPTYLRSHRFVVWAIAQLSFVQFWNPPEFRSFGVGVVNGSLWTIPVELSFYVFVPILYRFGLVRMSRNRGNLVLAALAIASFALWYWVALAELTRDGFLLKLARVSLPPHLHMFLIGVMIQRNFGRLSVFMEGKAIWWLLAYVPIMAAQRVYLGGSVNPDHAWLNLALTPLTRVILAGVAVSFAFSLTSASNRLLRGNDASYGLYIYHALVMNAFVHFGLKGQWWHFIAAFATSMALSVVSWKAVEQPALRRKAVPSNSSAP